jgi:molybdenum cofactor cytidylyltransferase
VIATLLLAAGSSRRFGSSSKLLEVVRGQAIVRWSAEAACRAAGDVVVVVPENHDEIRSALAGLAVRFAVNERAAEGMGTSMACGVAALPKDAEAVMVALADEPHLPADAYARVVAAYRSAPNDIVAPMWNGERGHPVLFDRMVFPELVALSGDQGARSIVDRVPGRVAFLEMGQAHPIDVDTREDLARIQAASQLSD